MALSYKLVVEVVSANGFGGDPELLNPYVELRFDGQRSETSVKEKTSQPNWNESFSFSVSNIDRLSGVSLDAYVYSFNQLRNSKSLLGKVQIPGTSFANSNDDGPTIMGHKLSSGTTISILERSKAVLLLKVSLIEHRQRPRDDNPIPMVSIGRLFLDQRSPEPGVDYQLREIKPAFQSGRLVEHMPYYLYVRVVKARNLPDVDATGSLDPFVEVRAGKYKAKTKHLNKEQNPEWNATFAFSMSHINMCRTIHVTVMDKDKVRDDFVGMLSFDHSDPDKVPERLPDENSVQPKFYDLLDKHGNIIKEGACQLMIAIWKGLLADEAYPDAWDSASFDMDVSVLPHIKPKMYDSPSLWYVRVAVIDFEYSATGSDDDDQGKKLSVYVSLGHMLLKTKIQRTEQSARMRGLISCTWNEEFMLVAAEPFDQSNHLRIYVKERIDEEAGEDITIGETTILLASLEMKIDGDHHHHITIDKFDIRGPAPPPAAAEDSHQDADEYSSPVGPIRLRNCLEGGYKALYEPPWRTDDERPTAGQGRQNPPMGVLDLGIIEARITQPSKTRRGKATSDIYCVAKYGGKWARTRTVVSAAKPAFNEQYTWDVFDTATVLTVGVFDNGQLQQDDEAAAAAGGSRADILLGTVHIRLSYLERGKIHAHAYPLLLLQREGLKRMGEVHLAVRFSRTTSMLNALFMYSRPTLPRMHYTHPITAAHSDVLRHHGLQIVATRLSQMDPPLRKEVVEHMCAERISLFSLRKSKANFFRLLSSTSPSMFISLIKWFQHVRSWRNPTYTLSAHAIISLALWFHQLILPSVLLYIFFIVCWNYRFRPRWPPHYNVRISYAEISPPDELDEEFDTFPTSRDPEQVKVRYDRLRQIAGRVMLVLGDLATQQERIQALWTWRDPEATVIFGIFVLLAAIMLYCVPLKILVAAAWIYIMLPRTRITSAFLNFFRRLPNKNDFLL